MIGYPFATSEQVELAETARMILEKELKPRLSEFEKANGGKGQFPVDVYKKLADAGYCGIDIPEEWGGFGFDNVTKCLILEEMAKVDVSTAFALYGGTHYFNLIEKSHISREEKQKAADRILAGDTLVAFCLTEPNAGSDTSHIKTTAVKDGNEWVINGTKTFISNGPLADYFIVFAWTDKTKSPGKGITGFLVEKERGVKVGNMEDKLGLKLSMTSEIIFDEVRVPEDHIVGEEGLGLRCALGDIEETRIVSYSLPLGIAQAAIDCAAEYAKMRMAFGKPIFELDRVGDLFARMYIRTKASHAILYEGARCLDEGIVTAEQSSAIKNFVAESTTQTALDAMQVFGGYGYMKDYPVEKLLRDSKIFEIFEGSTQVNNLVIHRALMNRYQ